MTTPENPPAFPFQEDGPCRARGMTLHDYFVGQALPEALRQNQAVGNLNAIAGETVDLAFRIADECLAERQKRKERA